MKVKLDAGAIAPRKAHTSDAGFDIFSPRDFELMPKQTANIDTGVHVEIPAGHAGFVKSKSGLMCNHSITAGEGVIDVGYTGSMVVNLTNNGREKYYFYAGDKIAQLVLVRTSDDSEIEIVDELTKSERGNGGFGSTGR